jgi:hypothetical protein
MRKKKSKMQCEKTMSKKAQHYTQKVMIQLNKRSIFLLLRTNIDAFSLVASFNIFFSCRN